MGNIVTMGELLLRLSTIENRTIGQSERFDVNYGGGEANVAVSLSKLGYNTVYVTKLPDNKIGDSAKNAIYKNGVNTENIVTGGERIGTYYLETGSSVRPSKVIYDRKYSSFSMSLPEEYNYDDIFKNCEWFHFSGITPALGENGIEIAREFLKQAKKRKIKISMDVNYRSSLWSMEKAKDILSELIMGVDVAFVGPYECRNIFGCTSEDDEDVLVELGEKYNVKYIVNSLRESMSATHNIIKGRIVDTESKMKYYSSRYDVDNIIDRVGGGDALAAGVIAVLFDDFKNYEYALEFGICASAIKHTIRGDYNTVSRSEVEHVINSGGNGAIKR